MLRSFFAFLATLLARLRKWVFARLGRPLGIWVEDSAFAVQGGIAFAPWAGNTRSYRLYLPPGLNPEQRVPLWLWLHGCRQSAENFASGTRIALAADAAGAMVLMPQQLRRANPYRCWNWFDRATQQGKGEAAIIIAMLEKVAAHYPVDRQRVCVGGLSAGAALAAVLASCYPERFGAVAMHSGVSYAAAQSPLSARTAIRLGSSLDGEASAAMARLFARANLPVPALVIHGEDDEAVPSLHLEQVASHFVAYNRRPGEPVEMEVADGQDGGRRYCAKTWRQGSRLLVRGVLVEGLGHAWSGGNAREEYHDANGPEATALVVNFFQSECRRLDVCSEVRK